MNALRTLAAAAALRGAAACSAPAADARAGAAEPPAAWSAPTVLPSPAGGFSPHDHRVAALRSAPGGALHALFLDDADGDGRPDRLLHAAFDGAAWSAPVAIDAAPGPTGAAVLAIDGDGRAHALWLEGEGRGDAARFTRVLHRVRDGDRWTEIDVVHTAPDTMGLPEVLAAWTDGGGSVHALHAVRGHGLAERTLDGDRWSPPMATGVDGSQPHLAVGPDGQAALAEVGAATHGLLVGVPRHGDVFVRARRGGAWGPRVGVGLDGSQHSHAPRLAWDRRGTLHAVWLEGQDGRLFPTRLLHASSPDGGARWTEAADVVASDGRTLYSPRLAADGAGRLHLTFTRFRHGVGDPRHFHAVWDGSRWSAPAEILPADGARDSELETAVDDRGTLHALWKAADGRYRHATLDP